MRCRIKITVLFGELAEKGVMFTKTSMENLTDHA
jgi:hypothetical protein